MNDRKRSLIEKGMGSLATESALTLIGALSGNPLGSLLPILTKSLASERQRARIEKALVEVNATLTSHETLLRDLTDPQYKLINETILAFLNTTNSEKLTYLRNAVSNSLTINHKV